jgi:hypothetical protein
MTIDQQRAVALARARRRRSESLQPIQEEKPDEDFVEGNLLPAFKAGTVGGVQTLMELIDPTPMFGGERIASPIKPDFTADKKAAAQIIDESRSKYGDKGIGSALTGAVVETASNPLSWVGGGALKEGVARTATSGGKILNAALRGAQAGASSGVGENDSRLENAGIGALTGGAIRGAGEAIGSVASTAKQAARGVVARSADALDEQLGIMKSASSDLYKKSFSQGAVLNNNGVNKILNKVSNAVYGTGKLHPRLHTDTMGVLKDFQDTLSQNNGRIGLEELDQQRRLLSGVINKNRVSNPEDALKAVAAKEALDDVVDSLKGSDIVNGATSAVKGLQEGISGWAKAKRFEAVADVVRDAEGDITKLKNGLMRLVKNPKTANKFNGVEKKAILNAAKNSAPELLLNLAGKVGFDFGKGVGNPGGRAVLPAALATGGSFVSPLAIPAVIGGTISRQLQKYVARGKAEEVLRMIQSGDREGAVSLLDKMKIPHQVFNGIVQTINNLK